MRGWSCESGRVIEWSCESGHVIEWSCERVAM